MRGVAAGLALCALACGRATPSSPAAKNFVATDHDFEPYQGWATFRDTVRVPPAHTAHRSVIYANRVPPRGAREFPIGTILIRVDELAEDPTKWEVHAMAKRGGFNAAGARGWEFFGIALDSQRRPHIEWRGEGPEGAEDGYHLDDGGMILGCNQCHASATGNDSVFSPELTLTR